jgi:hypothetical protein
MRLFKFEYSPKRGQWFARLDGCQEYGRGTTKEDALYNLFMECPEQFGVFKVDIKMMSETATTPGIVSSSLGF